MKNGAVRFKTLLLVMSILAMALPLAVAAASIVNDSFSDGNSQNQDLANNSMRFSMADRTLRTDAVGSVTFESDKHNELRCLLGLLHELGLAGESQASVTSCLFREHSPFLALWGAVRTYALA